MYAASMSQCQAHGRCEWLTPDELRSLDISSIPTNGPFRLIIEVDLAYDSHLHPAHNMLPLAPVKRAIRPEELSLYAKSVLDLLRLPLSRKPKLLLTLESKNNYCVSCRTAQIIHKAWTASHVHTQSHSL
jgi:hypothetical protein